MCVMADDETTMPGTVLNRAAGSIDDQSTRSVGVSLSTGASSDTTVVRLLSRARKEKEEK